MAKKEIKKEDIAAEATASTEKKPNMMQKKLKVSAELAAFSGQTEVARSELSKILWAYIKENKLQDSKDGKVIIPDVKLATVLGTDRITMFEMTKIANKHFVK